MDRTRFYYITRSLEATVKMIHTMENKGIPHNQIHVIGKNDDGLVRHKIQEGSILETYDMVHVGQEGALVGFVLGFVFSMTLLWWNPFALDITFWMVVPVWILFTMYGAWSGGLIGTHARNYHIKPYLKHIEKGHFLSLVDVDEHQRETLKSIELELGIGAEGQSETGSNPFEQGLAFLHAKSPWPNVKR